MIIRETKQKTPESSSAVRWYLASAAIMNFLTKAFVMYDNGRLHLLCFIRGERPKAFELLDGPITVVGKMSPRSSRKKILPFLDESEVTLLQLRKRLTKIFSNNWGNPVELHHYNIVRGTNLKCSSKFVHYLADACALAEGRIKLNFTTVHTTTEGKLEAQVVANLYYLLPDIENSYFDYRSFMRLIGVRRRAEDRHSGYFLSKAVKPGLAYVAEQSQALAVSVLVLLFILALAVGSKTLFRKDGITGLQGFWVLEIIFEQPVTAVYRQAKPLCKISILWILVVSCFILGQTLKGLAFSGFTAVSFAEPPRNFEDLTLLNTVILSGGDRKSVV